MRCMCMVCVMVLQFVPQLNTSDVFRLVEYQPEECLLEFMGHCKIQVHFAAFTLQLSGKFITVSLLKKVLFRLYITVHVVVHEGWQNIFVFSKCEYGEDLMQRVCSRTTSSECNVSDLVIWLGGWNFATGSIEIASCSVTFCLQMKLNAVMTISIIKFSCVVRWESSQVTFNYVPLSVCGVQFWTISWWSFHLWRQSYRTAVPMICRRNCPKFCRTFLWINNVVYASNMTQHLLMFHLKLEIFLMIASLRDGSDMVVPKIGEPGLQT